MLLHCGVEENLRVPWTARRSNQSVLKEISPEYSVERLMLKLHYFGHLMRRANSLEKTLMLGKIEGRRRKGWQDEMVGWHHWLDGLEFEQALGVGEGQRSLACCSPWGRKELDTTEGLNNSNSIKVLRPRELGRFLFCDAGNSKTLLRMGKYFWCFHHSSCILPSLGE